MKYVRGFMMAWGNFTAVPCPYRQWREEDRRAMLCMLPLVGLIMGGLTAALWVLLDFMQVPPILTGVILTSGYFMSTGFIHLDGFMDCSDAIMSRRPELEDRQRILKDSAVGAFAVIAVCVMFMVFAASMIAMAEEFTSAKAGVLPVMFALSRGLAADGVLRFPAMDVSGYSSMAGQGKQISVVESAVYVFTAALPIVIFIVSVSPAAGQASGLITLAGAVVTTMASGIITCYRDRKQLGGMNGDIAGHMIVMSEAAGVFAAALLSNVQII